MRQKLTEIVEIISSDPAVEIRNRVQRRRDNTTSGRHVYRPEAPPGAARLTTDEVIARLRPKLAKIPGAPTYLQAIQDLRIGGRASSAQYQYTLQSVDLAELNTWAPRR